MIKCVTIDDEPLARECIANYVREVDFLDMVGMGSNPMELTQLMNHQDIDLIFLDIQMPVMNGIDYLKMLQNPPMVVFTTAYPNYALEGFQLDVLDYLLKPITFNRFFKAANKAREYFQLQNQTPRQSETPGYFFVKCDHKFEKIYFEDILFVQAMQNYVIIYTAERKYMTLMSLKSVEENLQPYSFIRTHKSYIVSIPRIQSIENHEIVIDDFRIPISRNYRKVVLEQILGDKLWKGGE